VKDALNGLIGGRSHEQKHRAGKNQRRGHALHAGQAHAGRGGQRHKDELKFRRGGKTILTVCIRDDHFDFILIFGKAERKRFEQERDTYPQ
jgi:hypothetical protein